MEILLILRFLWWMLTIPITKTLDLPSSFENTGHNFDTRGFCPFEPTFTKLKLWNNYISTFFISCNIQWRVLLCYTDRLHCYINKENMLLLTALKCWNLVLHLLSEILIANDSNNWTLHHSIGDRVSVCKSILKADKSRSRKASINWSRCYKVLSR
jgi:hypothetical protein